MIKTAIRANYNMVIVFDEYGRQMPEYQGKYKDVKSRIMIESQAETKFVHWFGVTIEPDIVEKINW